MISGQMYTVKGIRTRQTVILIVQNFVGIYIIDHLIVSQFLKKLVAGVDILIVDDIVRPVLRFRNMDDRLNKNNGFRLKLPDLSYHRLKLLVKRIRRPGAKLIDAQHDIDLSEMSLLQSLLHADRVPAVRVGSNLFLHNGPDIGTCLGIICDMVPACIQSERLCP